MKLIKATCLTAVVAITFPVIASAATYTLPYKKDNRWVAKEDAKELRLLVKEAKKTKKYHVQVQLPEKANTQLYLERLEILRKILERNLKRGVIIEQVAGNATSNKITVMFAK